MESRGRGDVSCHFGNLDGRDLTAMGRRWRIEVYSVRDIELERYVQLALLGDPSYMVTVQLSVAHGVRDLVLALVRWLTRPSASGALIRVM